MHPSTALATVLVDEWVRCGVREVVLSPGSRSAPLAYAVQQAQRAGRVRLHVRVDERSAGFLALGLAKVSRRPALLVTTSGTAVANLHPAVLEAHHGCVPMIVCTADRPAELRGTGANQTTVQPGIFPGALRWTHDQPPPSGSPGEAGSWRSNVCRGWAAAVGGATGEPGPVHLNVAFRDPLAPALPHTFTPTGPDPVDGSALEGRADGTPWVVLSQDGSRGTSLGQVAPRWPARTLVLMGDLPDPAMAGAVLDVARRRGWPVVAEPWGTSDRRGVLPHGPLLLTDDDFLAAHPPDLVLTVGRLTLHREVGDLLRRPGLRVEQVSATSSWTDPSHVVAAVHPLAALLAGTGPVAPEPGWAQAWHQGGQVLAGRLAPMGRAGRPTGLAVARVVRSALADGDTLMVGSSNPPRDLDLADDGSPRGVRTVVGNRGLAGIDGMVSTGVGVALTGTGRTIALMGDLTFLHDLNGLLIGPGEPRPSLTVVVVNDDGGGIFATLEYGSPERAEDFERVFGTPTGADLAALCRGHGVTHQRVSDLTTLAAALTQRPDGLLVLEVLVDRAGHREQRAALAAAARSEADGA